MGRVFKLSTDYEISHFLIFWAIISSLDILLPLNVEKTFFEMRKEEGKQKFRSKLQPCHNCNVVKCYESIGEIGVFT